LKALQPAVVTILPFSFGGQEQSEEGFIVETPTLYKPLLYSSGTPVLMKNTFQEEGFEITVPPLPILGPSRRLWRSSLELIVGCETFLLLRVFRAFFSPQLKYEALRTGIHALFPFVK